MKRPRNVLLALGWYDHRLLQGIATPLSLKLQQSRTFATGNVLLTYGPE